MKYQQNFILMIREVRDQYTRLFTDDEKSFLGTARFLACFIDFVSYIWSLTIFFYSQILLACYLMTVKDSSYDCILVRVCSAYNPVCGLQIYRRSFISPLITIVWL